MDLRSLISTPTAPVWPIVVEEGQTVVVIHNGKAWAALGPGKHRRGLAVPLAGRGIPVTGDKRLVTFNVRDIPITHNVDRIVLSDKSRVGVELSLTVRCTTDAAHLLTVLERYSADNLPTVLQEALDQELRRIARSGLSHMTHDSFSENPDLRRALDVEGVSVLDGLAEIAQILSVRPTLDQRLLRSEEIIDKRNETVISVEAEADVEDVKAGRRIDRELRELELTARAKLQVARWAGVPFPYLDNPELYERQLESHAETVRAMLANAREVAALGAAINMDQHSVRNLVSGIFPMDAPKGLPGGDIITSRLSFDTDLDELLDESGLRELVDGSTVWVDRENDNTQGEIVVVSTDPPHVERNVIRNLETFDSRLKLTRSFWSYVQYDDNLARLLEDYFIRTLPPRSLQGVQMSVAELRERGRNLEVTVAVTGIEFSKMKGTLIGKGGKRIKQLQKLLPYRDIDFKDAKDA